MGKVLSLKKITWALNKWVWEIGGLHVVTFWLSERDKEHFFTSKLFKALQRLLAEEHDTGKSCPICIERFQLGDQVLVADRRAYYL